MKEEENEDNYNENIAHQTQERISRYIAAHT